MRDKKQRKEIDKAVRNILNYMEKSPEWSERFETVFNDLFFYAANYLEIDHEDLIEELMEAGYDNMIFAFVFESFASTYWDDEPQSFLEDYLERRGWRESAYARRYLKAMNDAELNMWEVTGVEPGRHIEIRPFGTEEKAIRVIERNGSMALKQWDCLVGRLVYLDDVPMLTGAVLSFPPESASLVQNIQDKVKADMEALFAHLLEEGEIDELPDDFEQQVLESIQNEQDAVFFTVWVTEIDQYIHRERPILKNNEGEAFQLINIRFPVLASTEKVTQALDKLDVLMKLEAEEHWIWVPELQKSDSEDAGSIVWGTVLLQDKALELEVNSTERAELGQQMLVQQLGDLIGQPMRVYENIFDDFDDLASEQDITDFQQSEEGQAIIKDMLDQHYRQTLDEPVPQLNNKTPRECASDPALRQEVVHWLKTLENNTAHASMGDYDFSWIWKELGLERK